MYSMRPYFPQFQNPLRATSVSPFVNYHIRFGMTLCCGRKSDHEPLAGILVFSVPEFWQKVKLKAHPDTKE